MAKAATENDPLPPDVFFETIKSGSVNCAEEPAKFVNAISSEDWRTKIMAYLRGHFVPEDEKEEKQLALRARSYSIINDTLYHGGVCAPLLKCISQIEGKQLLQEIHIGMCSSHIRTSLLYFHCISTEEHEYAIYGFRLIQGHTRRCGEDRREDFLYLESIQYPNVEDY